MSQHMIALARAQEVRLYRAYLRRDIAEGKVDWREVLRNPDERAASMPVFDLITAIRFVGRHHTINALQRAGIFDERRPLRALTPRQREALIAVMPPFTHPQ